MLAEKVAVTRAVQVRVPIRWRLLGEDVAAREQERFQPGACVIGNRKRVDMPRKRPRRHAIQRHDGQQHVTAVVRLVEQERGLQVAVRSEPVEAVVLAQSRDVDAELVDEFPGHLAVERVLHVDGAAPGEPHRTALVELIALGVAAEVVVVVEDQDPRPCAVQLAMEVRGRESADAAADHDEVVGLVERERIVEVLALARERMCNFEGTQVRAAQPRERGRVIKRAAVLR